MRSFTHRHIGPRKADKANMLQTLGYADLDALCKNIIPPNIYLSKAPEVTAPVSEAEFALHMDQLAQKNKCYTNFIGQGYYGTVVPNVIRRNVLENPGWYTAYTPYQAEISQGRLEALLNFQTMVCDLTAMPIANASLLDEATAAAEAMLMLFNTRSRAQQKEGVNKFLIDQDAFAHTLDVLTTRAKPLGIELVPFQVTQVPDTSGVFGAFLQQTNRYGTLIDLKAIVEALKSSDLKVAVASDLLSLAITVPPGECGADVVIGTTQRFGVPMGYGGPHAAFFATLESYKRNVPGRIIGVSLDAAGQKAYRMALQTREQHIRRDKATSNICTAQALLAIMASMYAVYYGYQGIKAIAQDIFDKTTALKVAFTKMGLKSVNQTYFDTLSFSFDPSQINAIKKEAKAEKVNFFFHQNNRVSISIDESHSLKDLQQILSVFDKVFSFGRMEIGFEEIPMFYKRESSFLTHPIFQKYHSETEMMRYIKSLENKDISLTRSMISLGSCTMKLNAAAQLYPISDSRFSDLHPFVPKDQAQGYMQILEQLSDWLCKITGFDGLSFQPNSGAQGEYTGLMVIRAYQKSEGQAHRNIALIPSSAHGTNPASAVMAGLKVVVVKCDEKGNIDLEDLKTKAEEHKANLSCLMVTYPSTHGVFEASIKDITQIIHDCGGQVYMDGANMNAQVGLTSPGSIGADVCHLNLHKTFAIPHGGGGPGMGPIGVAKHLKPFLPAHTLVDLEKPKGISAVSAAPFGSALILLISYAYIKLLGTEGLKKSTQMAILNANYIKARLEKHYDVLYSGEGGCVAHEMIVDCRTFKEIGIGVEDIAKRLMDYGYHAPTMSFPVAGTLMIEPTESESREEIDRFCDVMIHIKEEMLEVEKGDYPKEDNVLVNAPHTVEDISTDNWTHSYSREKAVFPLSFVKTNKYWPPVKRIDNAHGDRNLICTCPSVEQYEVVS